MALKICHLNVRSLLPKIDDIRDYCARSSMDIFCVSESWLGDAVPDDSLYIDGYILMRQDRAGDNHGGVAIYLNKNLKYALVPVDIHIIS